MLNVNLPFGKRQPCCAVKGGKVAQVVEYSRRTVELVPVGIGVGGDIGLDASRKRRAQAVVRVFQCDAIGCGKSQLFQRQRRVAVPRADADVAVEQRRDLDVQRAARQLRDTPGDRSQIEHRAWDESVKSLTNYPEVLQWLDDNLPSLVERCAIGLARKGCRWWRQPHEVG